MIFHACPIWRGWKAEKWCGPAPLELLEIQCFVEGHFSRVNKITSQITMTSCCPFLFNCSLLLDTGKLHEENVLSRKATHWLLVQTFRMTYVYVFLTSLPFVVVRVFTVFRHRKDRSSMALLYRLKMSQGGGHSGWLLQQNRWLWCPVSLPTVNSGFFSPWLQSFPNLNQ